MAPPQRTDVRATLINDDDVIHLFFKLFRTFAICNIVEAYDMIIIPQKHRISTPVEFELKHHVANICHRSANSRKTDERHHHTPHCSFSHVVVLFLKIFHLHFFHILRVSYLYHN